MIEFKTVAIFTLNRLYAEPVRACVVDNLYWLAVAAKIHRASIAVVEIVHHLYGRRSLSFFFGLPQGGTVAKTVCNAEDILLFGALQSDADSAVVMDYLPGLALVLSKVMWVGLEGVLSL